MRGLGTLINTLSVITGGIIGLRLKNGLRKNFQETLMQACGISSMFIGISGALARILVFKDGSLETDGTILMILSLTIGSFLGEVLDLEGKMEILGENIKKKIHAEDDAGFVDGFVNASLIICIGAMAIVGSIEDGVSGDFSMLAAKAVLDMIIIMIFSSTEGKGAVFSFIPIFFYQGSITLIAFLFGNFVRQEMISALCLVGNVLIFCVGLNISFGKMIRVGNMLPALIISVLLKPFL